jgi:MFS family permease
MLLPLYKLKNRNLKLFYLLESLLSLNAGIILPVYVLYFRVYDITLFQVAILAMVFEATIILFELPTGRFADKFGRKPSVSIGFLLIAISAVIFFGFKSFIGFLIAEIVFGIAETFISGALEALMVDSLDSEEKEKRLPGIFANRTIAKTAPLLIGMPIGGLIAGNAMPFLFLPIMAIAVAGFITSIFTHEIRMKNHNKIYGNQTKGNNPIAKVILGNRAIMALFMVGILSNFAFEPADQFWQVLFSEVKTLNFEFFGFLTAIGYILVISVSKLTQKLYAHIKAYLLGTFFLIAIALYSAAQLPLAPALAGIIVYFSLRELIRPAISTHLNLQFEEADRATYLSSYNLACSVGEVASGLIAGLVATWWGVAYLFHLAAVIAILVPIIFMIVKKSDLKNRRKTA